MTTPESFRKTWRNIATAVAAGAAFLPSFILMLAILPVLDRVRRLTWTRAVLRGMGPAVVGILASSSLGALRAHFRVVRAFTP